MLHFTPRDLSKLLIIMFIQPMVTWGTLANAKFMAHYKPGRNACDYILNFRNPQRAYYK